MQNFLNPISRGRNCVCVSIILGYVSLKKIPSFLLWFGQVVFQEAPSGPTETLHFTEDSFEQNIVATRFAGTFPSSFVNLYSRKKEAAPMIMNFLMESCKPAIGQNKNEKQVHNAREQQTNSSAISSPKDDGLTPFPSDVSMLWNLCRDPTPLGSPCPTKTNV